MTDRIKRVLVLGGTGMLGHMVMRVLSEEDSIDVQGTHIMNRNDKYYYNVMEGIEKLDELSSEDDGYDYYINCVGITNDKIELKDPRSIVRAIKINSIFPNELAVLAEAQGANVIHMSTDGVFAPAEHAFNEDSLLDCVDLYGKTKSIGETHSDNFLNLRCSIIGPSPYEQGGLFEWFRSQPTDSTINGFTNHHWNGVTTLQFAELCKEIIMNNCFNEIIQESHCHHFCPNRPVTKYDLLLIFKDVLGRSNEIVPCEDKRGSVKRILETKYSSIKKIFDDNLNINNSIQKFPQFMVQS